jgi:hypothetical protein
LGLPGAPRERRDRLAAVAAQLRRPGDDRTQGRGDAGGVETRQDGIDGCAGAVAGDDHRNLLGRQAPLCRRAAPLA